ncbi:MAG: glycerophosphodiester phosphodiesterase family protein [Fimbriimonadaceae bacterium]|nr:glycerophosphodiester phosphodiesterase family protein [Fimbriimonadaceae bacterium]
MLNTRALRSVALVSTLGLLSACGAILGQTTAATTTQSVESSKSYVSFESAAALADHLRPGSKAGLLVSAHRGGPEPSFPENALETFENTLKYGPAILECDVRLTRDGVPMLLHDDDLDRTTTGRGPLDQEWFRVVRTLRLRDNEGNRTPYRVPTLMEALAWAEGRAILTLDIKRGLPPETIVDAIRRARAENRVTVIVYNLADLLAYRRLDRTLNIAGSVRNLDDVRRLVASGTPLDRLTMFTGVGKPDPAMIAELRRLGVRAILGTFGPIDERAAEEGGRAYDEVVAAGVGMLATDNPQAAFQATRTAVGR